MEGRENHIKKKIIEEVQIESMQLIGVKQLVWTVLIEDKKYQPGDIVLDPEFTLQLKSGQETVSIDMVVILAGMKFLVIKCSSSDIESWERYVTAFARAVNEYQIPYAMVTDGEHARIIDVLQGTNIGVTIHDIFTRNEALEKIKNFKKVPCPEKRLEREKSIVHAFEGIKCPVIQ
ncbi:MAG: type I restriction enzyme HsdR N-terminal domain-containing protein [Nitrospirota bacterium]